MNELFIFNSAVRHQPAIDEWLASEPVALFSIARHWFTQFRLCGADVKELMHDGYPVACVNEAAFGYVNVYRNHVNVGFYTGAFLPDPHKLLEGTGKRMRHAKVLPGSNVNAEALSELIKNAYADVSLTLNAEGGL